MHKMMKGFIAENWKFRLFNHPPEDAFSIDEKENIAAVADGVTRDPMPCLPDVNSFFGKLKFMMHYPKQSPAKAAADLFCKSFPILLKDFFIRDEQAIKSTFEEINNQIKQWNLKNMPNPDYVVNDYAGCVSSAMIYKKYFLTYGFICDCGLAVLDEKGNLLLRTFNDGPDVHRKHILDSNKLKNMKYNMPEARKIIRSEFRNNPKERYSFGVLTGEGNAMHYVRTGSVDIKPTDILLVYSDGLEQIIYNKDNDINGVFADMLLNKSNEKLERFCQRNVKSEGTLVYSLPAAYRQK